MSAVVIGTPQGYNYPLPGAFPVRYNTDGTITGSAKFGFTKGAVTSPLGNGHPKDSRAYCIAYTITEEEAFDIVEAEYLGVWSSSAVHVDIQASLQADPIETNPNFASTLAGTPGSPLNGALFDSNGQFLGWPASAPNNLGGVRSYLRPGNTYRFTVSTTNPSGVASAIGSVGGLASSISSGGLTVSQANGFMLQAVTVDYQYVGYTTVYVYSVVWVQTTPPGWNSLIY